MKNPTFLQIASSFAIAAPLVLTALAFAVFPDAAGRAHFIVFALRASVLGLGACVALRGMFLLGEASAGAVQRREPRLITSGAAA
jgi:hypothetical protein